MVLSSLGPPQPKINNKEVTVISDNRTKNMQSEQFVINSCFFCVFFCGAPCFLQTPEYAAYLIFTYLCAELGSLHLTVTAWFSSSRECFILYKTSDDKDRSISSIMVLCNLKHLSNDVKKSLISLK